MATANYLKIGPRFIDGPSPYSGCLVSIKENPAKYFLLTGLSHTCLYSVFVFQPVSTSPYPALSFFSSSPYLLLLLHLNTLSCFVASFPFCECRPDSDWSLPSFKTIVVPPLQVSSGTGWRCQRNIPWCIRQSVRISKSRNSRNDICPATASRNVRNRMEMSTTLSRRSLMYPLKYVNIDQYHVCQYNTCQWHCQIGRGPEDLECSSTNFLLLSGYKLLV